MQNIYLCCQHSLFRFVSEYCSSIIDKLEMKLLLIDVETYEYNKNDIYVFIQSIPTKILNNPIPNMYLLNTEQYTRDHYKNQSLELLNKGFKIINYSLENIKLLNYHPNLYYLPYQYNDSEINKLKKFMLSNEKKYDVVFCGSIDDSKRKKIVDELVNRGINVHVVNGKWDIERDIEISKGKILLNIHYNDNYNIHESIRCDRWNMAGMVVVSEKSFDIDLVDMNNLIIYEDYDNLVDKVIDVVNDYDQYYGKLQSKYDNQIKNIIENKHQYLLNVKNMFSTNYVKNIENCIQKNNLLSNTLELFSANWRCNGGKESYVKLGDTIINLHRGINILVIKNKKITLLATFDTCFEDYSLNIQTYIKKIYDLQDNDYLIMITHDDAINKMNPKILQNYLIFVDCSEFSNLIFRASYLMIYDLKNRNKIFELSDNQFPIHEWFELNDENKLVNLGLPVYLIVYNLHYFVKNSVKQLRKYTKNIHIIDNKSTYPKLLEYYDNEYEFFLHKMPTNYGHLVWRNEMYWQFPRFFAISDPDLEFNENLPNNFIDIMKELSIIYSKGKVGFALDISDSHLFYQSKNYNNSLSIEEWEKRWWLKRIYNEKYELYDANIDTTFCVVNKQFKEEYFEPAIRMAGDFTCKHIPWYEGWHNRLDKDEWDAYKKNNISSSVVKLLSEKQSKYNGFIKQMDDALCIINNVNTDLTKYGFTIDKHNHIKDHLNNSMFLLDHNKQFVSNMLD